MTSSDFLPVFCRHPQVKAMADWLLSAQQHVLVSGLHGSAMSVISASLFHDSGKHHFLIIAEDSDQAAYFYNDIRQLLPENDVFYFPSSYKKAIKLTQLDASNEILRTEVLNRMANHSNPCVVITYPEALVQKVVSLHGMKTRTLKLKSGESISIDFLSEMLIEYGFSKVDFVYEPGQFSVRGGIVDIFSFAYELPYRCDFFGDEIESIRIFDIESQLSKEVVKEVEIIPDLLKDKSINRVSFLEYFDEKTLLWMKHPQLIREKINQIYDETLIKANSGDNKVESLQKTHISGEDFDKQIGIFRIIEMGDRGHFYQISKIEFRTSPQPVFHKNFDLVAENLKKGMLDGYQIFILSDSTKQTDRLEAIFSDRGDGIVFQAVKNTLHEGFIDHDISFYLYTDHQLFDRFHRYHLRTDKTRQGKVVMTLKELNQFRVGDYMVHVDHGIGVFGGLIKTNVNGKMQEMLKLMYKDDDIIFVSIHSLHRISRYKGKEGEPPRINKLGTGAWERLKERTKTKVKDIARDLIRLYARRKAQAGFQFSPDSYLQQELEASFIYEDTPDQIKSTADVKKDMESSLPMDRLVCGDVGFGKTEVAMRAAFKAATDGKQTAVLVPTTVLALQHYHSFSNRFKDFPVRVEYLSRARTPKQTKEVLEELENGKIDIVIGTHKLVGKSVKFKDLGLLIIDEEQRFGVAVKEKLKELKANVDTLTMTATPIPRTLQFSLMGARDLSIISTPPPNRFPVQTEIHIFDEELIKEAIQSELNRNGQVFFINNRIQSIYKIEAMIRRLIPGVRVAVGHGQMPPEQLENIIIDFIEYEYDVLVATTIIESGIDIPNVNTIIINSAHQFGLSDLHQLRGRVGRSNRKAYCYLMAPELSLLTPEARRRLNAIETFSELGSGFNIAMQDLDIRGAGNMLGAEQSGFIADLGYETYQRILNEAVHELKDEEFSELFADEIAKENSTVNYVTDCLIDTDLELMFPSEYVENVSERIALYRELDSTLDEASLVAFEQRLEDRFGKLPDASRSLLLVVRLRWLAMRYGVEKLKVKNDNMIISLVSNPMSLYYQSDYFGKILRFMTNHPRQCKLREQNGRRSVVFGGIRTIEQAYAVFLDIDFGR